jgi:hypothetical protein
MGRALLWIFGTALAAALATFGIGVALPDLVEISQREGAYAMAVAFVYTPAAFVLGAVAGLVIWLIRR